MNVQQGMSSNPIRGPFCWCILSNDVIYCI